MYCIVFILFSYTVSCAMDAESPVIKPKKKSFIMQTHKDQKITTIRLPFTEMQKQAEEQITLCLRAIGEYLSRHKASMNVLDLIQYNDLLDDTKVLFCKALNNYDLPKISLKKCCVYPEIHAQHIVNIYYIEKK